MRISGYFSAGDFADVYRDTLYDIRESFEEEFNNSFNSPVGNCRHPCPFCLWSLLCIRRQKSTKMDAHKGHDRRNESRL